MLLTYLQQLRLRQDPSRRPRKATLIGSKLTDMLSDPNDLRGVVAVTRTGQLVLITSPRMGVTTTGTVLPTDTRQAIILGRFATDFLASGRSFRQWCHDRGYHSPVSPTAEAIFSSVLEPRR